MRSTPPPRVLVLEQCFFVALLVLIPSSSVSVVHGERNLEVPGDAGTTGGYYNSSRLGGGADTVGASNIAPPQPEFFNPIHLSQFDLVLLTTPQQQQQRRQTSHQRRTSSSSPSTAGRRRSSLPLQTSDDTVLNTPTSPSPATTALFISFRPAQSPPTRLVLPDNLCGEPTKQSTNHNQQSTSTATSSFPSSSPSIVSISPEPTTNVLYYACSSAIGALNLTNNRFQILYKPDDQPTTTITDMKVWNSTTIYWIEDQRVIKFMDILDHQYNRTSGGVTTTSNYSTVPMQPAPPKLLYKYELTDDGDDEEVNNMYGLAVDSNRTVYFTAWTHRLDASIFKIPFTSVEPLLVSSNLRAPTSLTLLEDGDSSSLLFFSSAPGIYFTIQTIDLTSSTSQEHPDLQSPATFMRIAHQHGSSLAVLHHHSSRHRSSLNCSTRLNSSSSRPKVLWTDVGKRLRIVNSSNKTGRDVAAGSSVTSPSPPSSSVIGENLLGSWGVSQAIYLVASVPKDQMPSDAGCQSNGTSTNTSSEELARVLATGSSVEYNTSDEEEGAGEEEQRSSKKTDVAAALNGGGAGGRVSERKQDTTNSNQIRLCSKSEAEELGCHNHKQGHDDQAAARQPNVCVVLENTPLCLTTTSTGGRDPSPYYHQHQDEELHQQQGSAASSRSSSPWPPQVIATMSVISTLATIMSLVAVYMTVRVRNLSRKPIIRRRVVVSRRTSESSSMIGGAGAASGNPTSVCEMIDIENCCNMNICETPCYERTLLQPIPGSSSSPTSSSQTVISVNSTNTNWSCDSNSNNKVAGSKSKPEEKRCLVTI